MQIFMWNTCLICHEPTACEAICEYCEPVWGPAPGLCGCARFHAVEGNHCEKPFVSIQATTLSIGRTHQLIKAWKTYPGLKTEAAIFRKVIPDFERFLKKTGLDDLGDSSRVPVLCPVPQNPKRQWRSGKFAVLDLTRVISERFGFPILGRIGALDSDAGSRKQALMGAWQRRLSSEDERFRIKSVFTQTREGDPMRPIILIDDFLTTGSTLKSAAKVLRKNLGQRDLFGYCVGYRPSSHAQIHIGGQAHRGGQLKPDSIRPG